MSVSARRIKISYPPPASLTLETRDSIISCLLATDSIKELNNELLAASQATGWVDAVRKRTLQLLRSGECSKYHDIVRVVIQEAWEDRGRPKGEDAVLGNWTAHLNGSVSRAEARNLGK